MIGGKGRATRAKEIEKIEKLNWKIEQWQIKKEIKKETDFTVEFQLKIEIENFGIKNLPFVDIDMTTSFPRKNTKT